MNQNMQGILAARIAPFVLSGAYANTLTGVIGDLYAGLDVVSRELVGFIPSVTRNATAERAAVGQSVIYPIAPEGTAGNVTPAMTVPEPTDQTEDYGTMTISKSRFVSFGWTGEEQRALNAAGPGHLSVQAGWFAQGVRKLVNELETDIAVAAYKSASRAYGSAGTAPFASGVGDSAQLRKILDDNGAPLTDRSLIISTAAGANLRTNTQLTKANEAGSQMTLRDGMLLDMHGFAIKESGQAQAHTKGTGASWQTTAAFAVGDTTITVDTGSGTILAGDVITFAGDTNKYVVVEALSGGSLRIGKPGLRAPVADNTVITVGNNFTASVGFSADAIHTAIRAPALPQEGDLAMDRMLLTDPRSGIVFEVSLYPGYRKIRAEVALAWGVEANKEAHIALLLG